MQGFDSVAAIREANAARGHYFFSADTMRFFRSRVGETVYGRRFFITSEQYDDASPRLYTVREANDDGSIDTFGEFQGFKTHREAMRAATRLANERGVPEYDRARTLAEAAGRDAGAAAGSWVIDGNTHPATARKIVAGYDDGDPETMDMQPSPLSGEWADGLTEADVLGPLGRDADDDDADDLLSAFENGYALGYWDRVLTDARALAEPEPEPEPDDDEPAESPRPADEDRAGGRNTMTRAASGDRATPEPEPAPSSLATLFAPGQLVFELDDDDFRELLEICVEEADRRGWGVDVYRTISEPERSN